MTTFRLEKDLQTACEDYLKSLDNCWFVHIVGGATQAGGIPDLLICYEGRFYAAELKKDANKYGATGRQKIILRRIARAGGYAAKVETLQELKDLLKSPQ